MGVTQAQVLQKQCYKNIFSFFLSEGFQIVPLSYVVNHINNNLPFPKKTLAITVDDAYKSLYQIAHPVFLKHQIPYTIFVNTEGH